MTHAWAHCQRHGCSALLTAALSSRLGLCSRCRKTLAHLREARSNEPWVERFAWIPSGELLDAQEAKEHERWRRACKGTPKRK